MSSGNAAGKQCPRCGSITEELLAVNDSMREALQKAGADAQVPSQICNRCYEDVTLSVSQGLRLRLEKEAREKNKNVMWKNRVNLIKQARNLMAQKSYSEAAVNYEKYLRLLEVVYNVEKGALAPEVFNNSKRSKELTVVASVYWDLLRIYDTSPRYGNRMTTAADKLAKFLPLSPIYPDIIKKAETFAKTANNGEVMRNFLKRVKSGKGPCFIAEAVYHERPWAAELWLLRHFRDEVLLTNFAGRFFVKVYYRYSPPLASFLREQPQLQRFVRHILQKIAYLVEKSLSSSKSL